MSLFEVGDDYLATAYVDGSDLARRLNTPMDPATAVHIALQIASALGHAHARGVIHRDVKPSNILLDRRGNAFLADFGLADIAGDDEQLRGGTPGFMAPEQDPPVPLGGVGLQPRRLSAPARTSSRSMVLEKGVPARHISGVGAA